ncbi:MAG: ammonia-forming cytochrome c nitrite reductase subunit c552 [Campylobacterota bacterium]|nr:ammonia-forming cytochrome c nitrite reductase subunit c552 [Campylobacterota bacterium]
MITKIILLLLTFHSLVFAEEYIGDKACQSCHTKEHKEWSGSHHDLAMQEASLKTVLGDFNNAKFEYNGVTSTFFKKDGKFMVNTDGEDGKLKDFEISYTFGIYPLQQYMVKFPEGRVQVLTIAWDARTKSEGGQRWFHLHEGEKVSSGDVLHWTGPNLNWNYMCADCHSTNFQKNYNPKTKEYKSTYEQINVSCEECHGSGKEHQLWAENPKAYKGTLAKGLKFLGKKNRWHIDPKTQKPILENEINRDELMLCAKCHSRRMQFGDDFRDAHSFHDNYRLATLSETLYEADGQIKDEVYVYGSFVQSKMYEAGVTCSDCHNSHSLERRAVDDNVCNKCHVRVNYDNPKHSFHKKGSASCIDCHMPSRTYMGVDERNDHSFRVPRPDLSEELGTPNACSKCHEEKSNAALSQVMKEWYGETPKGNQQFTHAFHSSRENSQSAYKDLYSVLMSSAPDLAKATLVPRLGQWPSRQTHMTSLQMLRSKNPTMRIAALNALQNFPAQYVMKDIFSALEDEVQSVRLEAMRTLLAYNTGTLTSEQQELYDKVLKEYKESLLFNADRAESQVALAGLYLKQGDMKKAEASYKEALRIQKFYIPAYVNYAHYFQGLQKEQKALAILQKGVKTIGKEPLLIEPLALWYIRNGKKAQGIKILQNEAKQRPKDARLQYLYAVSIADEDIDKATSILEKALKHHTGDIAMLNALVYYYKKINNMQMSELYAQRLENMFRTR